MARYEFGASSADVVWSSVPGPGYNLVAQGIHVTTMWDSETGGTQLTDLQDWSGSPITYLTPGLLGILPRFFGPDGVTMLWADAGFGRRVRLISKDASAALVQWARNPDALITGAITRDSNGAATSAPVTWPDGAPGTYTADTVSTAFPGAVDAYHITYGSPVTKTITQPAVTRDSTTGAVTNAPAMVVT